MPGRLSKEETDALLGFTQTDADEASKRVVRSTMPMRLTKEQTDAALAGSRAPIPNVKDMRPSSGPDSSMPAPEEDALAPTTSLGATLRGATQGGTARFGDEIGAGAMMVPEAVGRLAEKVGVIDRPKPNIEGHLDEESAQAAQDKARPSMADTYRNLRDSLRADNKTAQATRPTAYGLGEFGGGMALPVPGSSLMKGAPMAARMGLGAAQAAGIGAAFGAGGSEAPDWRGVAKDAVTNGALAAPAGVAGAVIGKGGEMLAERFGGKASEAVSRADAMVSKDAEKLYRKAIGSLGGEVSAGRNADELMHEIVASASATAAQKQAAQSLINDPARLRMVQRTFDNAIQNFPGRMNSMVKAEKGVQDAAASNTPSALAAARDELLSDPIQKRVLPSMAGRLKRHIVPAIGTGIGLGAAHLAGVDPVYGLAAGQLFGQTSKQLLSHPAVQKMVFTALDNSSSGLSRALAKAGVVAAAEEDPETKMARIKQAAETSKEVAGALGDLIGPNQSKAPTLTDRFGG